MSDTEESLFQVPDMTVRIWKMGTPEIHGAGSNNGCVELVAFDGRVVQVVFREAGAVMLRGWCGTYERQSTEAEMDLYSRGERGEETLTFHGELPPVPSPARIARDKRLAMIREQRAAASAVLDRQRKEAELRTLADELGVHIDG